MPLLKFQPSYLRNQCHCFSVRIFCEMCSLTGHTWRVQQAGERTVETDANLHVIILTFRFDVCIHEIIKGNQLECSLHVCDIQYLTIIDHIKHRGCLGNSILLLVTVIQKTAIDNRISIASCVTSCYFEQNPNLAYTTPLSYFSLLHRAF